MKMLSTSIGHKATTKMYPFRLYLSSIYAQDGLLQQICSSMTYILDIIFTQVRT